MLLCWVELHNLVMAHKCQDDPNHRQLDCMFNSLLCPTAEQKPKFRITGPFVQEFTGNSVLLAIWKENHEAIDTGSCSIPWRDHEYYFHSQTPI